MSRPARIAAAAALIASLGAARATAEPSEAEKTSAAALFQEARRLMAANRPAEACPKFEESQRLAPGGGTLLNLAVCNEALGKTATAWAQFVEAQAISWKAGRDDRERLASEHITALEPRLSRLVILVPQASELPELTIRRDGTIVGRGAWGAAIPVDPGEHTVEATAPGHVSWSSRVGVGGKGDAQRISIPVLQISTGAAVAPAPATDREAAPRAASTATDTAPAAQSGPKIAGWSLLSGSVAAVGVGTYFALRSRSKHLASNEKCPTATTCIDDGAALESQARSSADVATAAFAVGLIAAGGGAYLLLTQRSPAGVAVAPGIAPGQAALSVAGRF